MNLIDIVDVLWEHPSVAMITITLVVIRAMIAMIDFIVPIIARLKRRPVEGEPVPNHDFTVLVPIFGDISYLRNVEFLSRYGSRVLLCTTTQESDQFNRDIEAVAARHGFRIYRSDIPVASRSPWRIFHHTLQDTVRRTELVRDEIMRGSSVAVDTTFCIFIDGDTVAAEDLSILAGRMAQEGHDLASVRVVASKQQTVMERLQHLEYQIAMDSRRVYPWLTSGAAMISRRTAINQIMKNHSLFFNGGDIEIGKLAKTLGYKVGHIPFVFLTDVPSTFRRWVRQRRFWFCGGFRHYIVNGLRFNWRYPFLFFYNTIVVYSLTPVRWYEVLRDPLILPSVIALYWVLQLLFHRRYYDSWVFWLFPIYCLFHVMVVLPMGVYTYCRTASKSRNAGIIRLRNKWSDVPQGAPAPVPQAA